MKLTVCNGVCVKCDSLCVSWYDLMLRMGYNGIYTVAY